MSWIQVYDPLGNTWLSTLAAALPIVLLLVALAVLEWKAQWAALSGLAAALLVSVVIYGMPVPAAAATAVYGAAYGLFPIGWIILAAVFRSSLPEAERLSVDELVRDLRKNGQRARHLPTVPDIVAAIAAEARAGDLVIIMSNGGFDGIHEKLLAAIEARKD